jgi:alpha-mannosidase
VTATIPDLGVEKGDALELVQPDGLAIPAQVIAHSEEGVEIAFVPRSLPPLGYAALTVRRPAVEAEHALRVGENCIENRYFRLELDEEGGIRRLLDKRTAREVIPAGQAGNRLELFQDGPEREAAWNVHDTFEKREYAWDPGAILEVVEGGPVRAVIRIGRQYRSSRIEQDVILYDRLPRIDFVTRADWRERQVMLKAAFPLAVRSMRATFEIQFGAVERPTHRNTSWDEAKFEVCGHRWADLSEAGYGVSLLNDCRYGYDARDNVLRLTLLRGTEHPDPDADIGHHEFTYSLLPHAGDWCEAETVRRAWELNAPVRCTPGSAGHGNLPGHRAFFEIDGPALIETLKPAEDGKGLVLRLYEPHGGRGQVVVRSTLPLGSVFECNHVEETGNAVSRESRTFSFLMGPFEIKTFRLIMD